ncbi:Rieske 2Fe-2S domain-containing protein [Nocardia sp. NPDC055321]
MKLPEIMVRALSLGAHVARNQLQGSRNGRAASTLSPGEHAIVEVDAKRVGVVCDRAGVLHAVEARCTHIDWELDFDHRTVSWKCPRHGARFSIDGSVLEGPATTALSQVELPTNLITKLRPNRDVTS